MTTEAERLAIVNAALRREAKEAARGDRDARKAISELAVKAATRTASRAGLAALFPGLTHKSGPPLNAAQVRAHERQVPPPIELTSSVQMPPAIQAGEVFTIAGLKADPTKPGGWNTRCKTGEETRLVQRGDAIEKA